MQDRTVDQLPCVPLIYAAVDVVMALQAKAGLGDTDIVPEAVLKQLVDSPGSIKADNLGELCVKQLKVLSAKADESKAQCAE